MGNETLNKLREVNAEKFEVTFEMKINGKVLHERKVEIPEYANEIIKGEETNFYYFFKEVANKFEDKINELHKDKIWRDREQQQSSK